MMKKLASGKSSGNHGEFLIYNAPALTIQGVNNLRWVSSRLVGIERYTAQYILISYFLLEILVRLFVYI